MLRHFKMELRRQQELENSMKQQQQQQQQQLQPHQQIVFDGQLKLHNTQADCNFVHNNNNNNCGSQVVAPRPLQVVSDTQAAIDMKKRNGKQQQQQQQQQPKRVRGRRSSKPMMEKRRRARINECLDILKSYVLTDSSNLVQLGIDPAASENQDEETIARQILKTSGLINRHRGRKNPNKLEKADILELTVDYVRRLHEQRDELLITTTKENMHHNSHIQYSQHLIHDNQTTLMPHTAAANRSQMGTAAVGAAAHCYMSLPQQVVPAHLNQPLTLDLSPKSRLYDNQITPPPTLRAYNPPPNTPLTPPPSSASSVQSNDLEQQQQQQQQQKQQHHATCYNQNQVSQMILSRVLDGYKLYDWTS